jgi:rhomboid protease GluP
VGRRRWVNVNADWHKRRAVLDIDIVLLWLGLAAAAGHIVRGGSRLWTAKAGLILAIGGLGVVFAPRLAGWAVGIAWFLLLALPGVLIARLVNRAITAQHYGPAEWLALAFRTLHPDGTWPGQPGIFRALRLAQNGAVAAAIMRLDHIAASPSTPVDAVLIARFHQRRLEDRLADWVADTPLDDAPSGLLISLHVRALCLLGRSDDLVALWAARRGRLSPGQDAALSTWASALMWLWVNTGQVAPLQRLLTGPLRSIPRPLQHLTLAWAGLRAGKKPAELVPRLSAVAQSPDREAARTAAQLLVAPPPPASLSAEQCRVIADSIAEFDVYSAAEAGRPRLPASPVTLILIALNLAMFAIEMAHGSSEDTRNLMALGALWPPYIIGRGQWWRVVAALFLHLGWLHLGLNMVALAVLGPLAEKTLGRVRILVIYAVSGLGSMLGLVMLMRLGWMKQELVIGASGAIMGLFGSLLASAASGWWRERSAAARRRLFGLAALVALQAAGDIATPQVSFAGHALGLGLGLLVGLALRHPGVPIPMPHAPRPAAPLPPADAATGANTDRRRMLGNGLAAGVALAAALAYPQRLQNALSQEGEAVTDGPPALTPRNVAGIRRLQFRFFGEIEGGVLSVDPLKPFGSDNPLNDLARATGVIAPDALDRLYLQVMAALPRFCQDAHLIPAVYSTGDRLVIISAAQILLIRALRWEVPDEDEVVDADPQTGAWPVACVDVKRPYGDLTVFEIDMAQALGLPLLRDTSGHVLPNQPILAQLDALHRSMAEALLIFVRFATWPA